LKKLAQKGAEPKSTSTRTRGTDELNLAEFPLAAITHRPSLGQKTLEFEDQIFDDGAKQTVHRRLVISGSDRFGLPTPLDTDVLLVLIHHTSSQNAFTDRAVSFSRYELVRFMGWDPGGKSYRRLDESLYKWASVTLYYHGAWWDKSVRTWRSRTFHILESLDLKGRASRGVAADDAHSSFTWNEVLFESFQANNIKSLNLDTYFALQSPTARQAYRFLDKRFYRSRRLEFDLRVFACEHVGLGRNYDSAQLKRCLEPALRELEEIGFLKLMTQSVRYLKTGRGEWKIVLVSGDTSNAPQPRPALNDLARALIERGVFESEATKLARQFSEERIRDKIRIHDWLLKGSSRTRLANPPGFLAKAIACDLPPPDDYKAHLRSEEKREKERTAARGKDNLRTPVTRLPDSEEMASYKVYIASLSSGKRAELEALALEAAGRFNAETYVRLKPKGGELFEQLRDRLILSYLRGDGVFPAK
jgi:plasmid replication initiation protein